MSELATAGISEVLEPSTGEVMDTVAQTPIDEIDERVRRGASAARVWQQHDPEERAALLFRIADTIDARHEELSRLESRNVGKPIREARGEVALAARTFRFYAGALDKHTGQTFPHPRGLHYTTRSPFGVVAAIVPWNFPLVLASWKIAPALAAGNSIIVKPAEVTPLTAVVLEQICREVDLPEDSVQVVIGPGGRLGRALVEHPEIRKLSFTGSTEVGREIAERAAKQFKRLTLELGGKAANIIFADADLDNAIPDAVGACFANAGQDCCARARILVQREVYDEARERLTALISALRVGDPLDDTTEIGPLISAGHRDGVRSHVIRARADGATIAVGGEDRDGPGYFFDPTLVTDVMPGMPVMQDEIFGPVAALHPFDTESEVVELANATPFGLSSSVWTRDADRAVRMAARLDAGVVSVNSNSSVHLTAPFGGWKFSGIGRELGMAALDAYTELKTVFQAHH